MYPVWPKEITSSRMSPCTRRPINGCAARFSTAERMAPAAAMAAASPLTRSSHHAGEDYARLRAARDAKLAGR